MKYIIKFFSLFLILFIVLGLSGCSQTSSDKNIKISVMGDIKDFYPGYKEGIERAVKDLNSEYFDTGYTVECKFEIGSDYEENAAILDAIVKDSEITALIGAPDMEINETAAKLCERNGKILVVPYFLDDSVYINNHYNNVFSMSNSCEDVGRVLSRAAKDTGKTRWAVCCAERQFETAEAKNFINYSSQCGIQIIDCVDITDIVNDFDRAYKRWTLLGVEGVMMFPDDDIGFELLKRLKNSNPSLICGGDTAFDNSMLIDSDAELQSVIGGFIIADEFRMRDMNDEERDIVSQMSKEYTKATDMSFDEWYIQGYNAVRMIADTAVKNNTSDSSEISSLLHNNGYSGLMQDFQFDGYGMTVTKLNKYSVYNSDGTAEEFVFEG